MPALTVSLRSSLAVVLAATGSALGPQPGLLGAVSALAMSVGEGSWWALARLSADWWSSVMRCPGSTGVPWYRGAYLVSPPSTRSVVSAGHHVTSTSRGGLRRPSSM